MQTYPAEAISFGDKLEYDLSMLEALRTVHNKFVKWRDFGLEENEYQSIPLKVRPEYFKNRITKEEYRQFYVAEYMPRRDVVLGYIAIMRNNCFKSLRFSPNIPDIPDITIGAL